MVMINLKKSKLEKPSLWLEPSDNEFIKIEILGYLYPKNDDYWEGNWLRIKVTIQAGAFNATYEGKLKTYNLKDFRRGLLREIQYQEQRGVSAYLQSLENWIEMKIIGHGNGSFDVQCVACDNPPYGNKLIFKLQIEKNEIEQMIEQVDEIMNIYPVRGKE